MQLKYFEEPAYEKLYDNIQINTDLYITNQEDWLERYFENINYYGTSSVIVPDVTLYTSDSILSTEEKNIQDLTNTIQFYNAYKNKLSPLQATNKYMWSFLAHSVFKNYVVSRWIKNPDDINEKTVNTIKKRFFVSDTKSLIRMNAISRLWWAGYLSYDENNATDHYHLTKILFTGQQICADILDTPFCGNKKIIKGILLGIKEYLQEDKSSQNLADSIRECIKYLRRYAAVTVIDLLTLEEISVITLQYLKSYTN